jgi:putative hydrolase of the HAD superfamily
MIKAVIFDLDNTLIDFLKMKRMACSEAIDAMIDAGVKIRKAGALKTLYSLYGIYGIEHQAIFQKFLKKVEGKINYKALAYAIIAYRRVKNGFLAPYPGAKQTLITLKEKGLKLAIVSDAPRLQAWLRLAAMKLDDFFDVVVALEDTGKQKPHRLPFRAALKNLKVKPEECLMVGDNPERDIRGAKAMGMKTCHAKYGLTYKADREKADFVINGIRELPDVIGKASMQK